MCAAGKGVMRDEEQAADRSYYQRVPPRAAPATVEAEPACGPPAHTARQLESTDRVRLEVTVSQGGELHSWPGATRFDARDVDELIRQGLVSTGSFAAYLASIFGRPGVAFHYMGEQSANGKSLFEYGYRVPLDASHFEIKVGAEWRPAAYEGEFWLDPQSLDLQRLMVRTSELPDGAPFCSASADLEYHGVPVGGSNVLLLRQSQLDIVLRNGAETRNVTTFSNCREYQAESEILFTGAADTESATAQGGGRGRVTLPLGLPVTLALAEPIDTDTAASGDAVSASVVKPVRRPGSNEVLIPAGAMVRGRIRRVEHHLLPKPYFLVRLAFNRVEVQGAVSPFVARSEPEEELVQALARTWRCATPASGSGAWAPSCFPPTRAAR
jgi:hypothetical protein